MLRLYWLPNPNFVGMGRRITLCTCSSMDAPILMDVRDQIPVAHFVFHWREQYYRRLAASLRAFEEHNKEIPIVAGFLQVHLRQDLGFRSYARASQLVAHRTGIVYVNSVI